MRVNIAQSSPPYTLSPHSSQNTLPSSLRLHRPSSKSTLRRSFSAIFNGHDFPNHPIDHFTPKSRTAPFLRHVDVLEPSFLGIRPETPDWPARDAVMRECIARRANPFEIPLSLKLIKMKQKFLKLEEELDFDQGYLGNFVPDDNKNNNNNNNSNSMNNLCCSTLFIIREVQSYALKNRNELNDAIISKIQREMTCSLVWLFKEVFAKTPEFMLQVMVLTSSFTTRSVENLTHFDEESKLKGEILDDKVEKQGLQCVVDRDRDFEHGNGVGVGVGVAVEHNKYEFVSPVKVEIERDDYEEFDRTDLLYQIGLLKDPNNTLLLSNYAQFLCLVSRDYDRAEECFKRAILLDRSDAEIISQFANFLWVVRKDLWGAEERFQEAVSVEPDNSYHASKYASFLWSTGGDETCYPIDPPLGKS